MNEAAVLWRELKLQGFEFCFPVADSEDTKVTNFMKSLRQHMQEESSDKFSGI